MDLCIPRAIVALLVVGICCSQKLILEPDSDEILLETKKGAVISCEPSGLQDGEQPNLKWIGVDNTQIGPWSTNNKRVFVSTMGSRLDLEFNPLEAEDVGTYTCTGTINEQALERKIKVATFDPIKIHSAENQHPVIYTDGLIECKVTGNPNPEVLWRFPNQTEIKGPRYIQEGMGLRIRNITKDDNGVYICRATQRLSMRRVQDLRVNVTVTIPPSLKGPPSASNMIVGKKMEIICEAEGTPKPTFKFTKDGQDLTDQRYKISTESDHALQIGKLVIEKLEDTDEGEYKCIAMNKGGEVSEAVFIDTVVPPTVQDIATIEKKDKSAGVLVCIAKGDPAPAITWRIKGSQTAITDTDRITIETATRTENLIEVVTSKLQFNPLESSDTNNYTCMASNTAGKEEKDGKVIVQFSPKFDNTPTNSAYGWLNHDTEIKCIIDAVPLPSVKWIFNGEEIEKAGHFTVIAGTRQVTSVLTVSVNIGNEDSVFGVYKCKGENLHGKAEYDINLIPASKPSAPVTTISAKTPTTVEIVIKPPESDGHQPIRDYKIEYFADGDAENKMTKLADISSNPDESRTRFLIEDLTADTNYQILVEARNNVGYGETDVVSAKTLPVQKPDKPVITSPKESDSANAYRLMWQTPLTGGAPLSGYSIEYNEVEVDTSSGSPVVSKVVGDTKIEPVPSTDTGFTIRGLKVNTYYHIKLKAINRIGQSDESLIIVKTSSTGVGEVRDSAQSLSVSAGFLFLLVVASSAIRSFWW